MTRGALGRLALLACIWGASFLLIKLALGAFTPAQVVLVRLAAGAAVLMGILALRRQRLPHGWAVWGHLGAMGVVANVMPFFLFAWAEQRITSGLAGVLNGTTPLFTLMIASLALPDEKLTRTRLAGFLVGFAGVVLVVGPWRLSEAGSGAGSGAGLGVWQTVAGQAACLLAAACYGVGFVYTRLFLSGRGRPLPLAAGQLSAATVVMVVLMPLVGGRSPSAGSPAGLAVAAAVTLGAVGTGLAYLLYYRLIAESGATSASAVTYLIPIVAVALGVVVMAEPVRWNLFAGAAVVLVGVGLAEGRLRLPSGGRVVGPSTMAAGNQRFARTGRR